MSRERSFPERWTRSPTEGTVVPKNLGHIIDSDLVIAIAAERSPRAGDRHDRDVANAEAGRCRALLTNALVGAGAD
jgi:hypothetical protein